jgi:hypothetical protein
MIINVFPKSKSFNKRIKKLSASNISLAVQNMRELEFNAELFLSNLENQEKLCQLCEKSKGKK